jgi:PST family polysaccharide transporter
MLLPKDLFAAVAGQVLLPSLSQALGDEEKMKEIVASAISGVAFLAFPLMAGISLVVGDIVELFLGPEWLPAVGLIQLLTVAGAVQSFWPIGNKVLLLSSDAKRLLRWGTVCTCTSIGAFAVGATYSVGAMAGLYAIVSVWNSALLIKMMAQERNVFSPWFVVSCLRVEFAMTFLMAIVAFSAQWLLDDFPIIARISITAAVGLLTYGVLAILIRPKGFLEFAHVAGVSRLFQVKNSERTYVNTHNAIN